MKNLCYIFVGPSGSGKTSLAEAVFSQQQKVISHTTRAPRPGEISGRDYFFVTPRIFEQMIAEEAFAEFDRYNGNYYGVSLKAIQEKLLQDDCFDVLTLPGFINLYQRFGQQIIPVRLNISKEETEKRMLQRGEDEQSITKRLALFQTEVKANQSLDRYPLLIEIDANQSLTAMTREFRQKRKA
ncbi:guanylate kinase [Enterococcus sp. LJL90]